MYDFEKCQTEPLFIDLFQVVLVIERILSFSITSPLMKFVTGLELLLEKAQVCYNHKNEPMLVERNTTRLRFRGLSMVNNS